MFDLFRRTASTLLGLIGDGPGAIWISILPRMAPCLDFRLLSSFFISGCDLRLNTLIIPFRGLKIALF